MPLVAHNALPTFDRLRRDGITVLSTSARPTRKSANCMSAF